MKKIAVALLVLALPAAAFAFSEKKGTSALDLKVVEYDGAWIPATSQSFEALSSAELPNFSAYENFLQRYGAGWSIYVEDSTGQPAYVGGQGIPMIPGRGNALTMADLPLSFDAPRRKPSVADVDTLVRGFLKTNWDLFRLDDDQMVLLPESGYYGNDDYLCFLNYQLMHSGVPVKDAVFQVRLNSGNLVDMGFSGSWSLPTLDPRPAITEAKARQQVGLHVGGWTAADAIRGSRLLVVPYFLGDKAPLGRRVSHRLVWEVDFQREGIPSAWQGWVDAHTGEVVKFEDTASYATYKRIRGQVYPEHYGGGSSLVARSFPYARENTQTVYASLGGLYSYPGGSTTSTLQGKYAFVLEACTTKPSLTSATGDLNFGGTTAQDCAYTGASFGNATEAALMGIYHVMSQKVTALTYLPSNTWLNGALRFEANANSQCNANWDGTDLSMFRSGSTGGYPCNNSGLIAGIFQHEFGHGMDSNDGLAPADNGTGEIYGDTCAIIQTHNSCIGDYFWVNDSQCGPNLGYGNACDQCRGVRDIDYQAKARNTPSTVGNFVCTDCWATSYDDPCGMEGHCAAIAMGETMWDLAVRDLPTVSGMDAATAWERFARLFYKSRPTSGAMYTCNCPSTSGGCNAANWYRTFRVVDDDNGNLCDGTPNAGAIYSAFNRHGIACAPGGSCPNEDNNSGTCPTIAAPTLGNPSAGSCQISLSWSSVANANEYRVYRNEAGCTKGFTQIGVVSGTVTTYIDTDVSPTVTYYYTVQGVGSNPACSGNMSTCKSATPNDCTTCVIPTAPTGVACAGGAGAINVTWTNSTTGDGYRVYRQKEGEFTWVNVSGDLGLVSSWSDTTVLCSPTAGQIRYRYKVRAYETTSGPCESPDSTLSAYCEASCTTCTPPGAPTLTSATGTCTGVNLAWSAGSGTTSSYNVYRLAGACGGTYTKIAGPVTGTSYSDTTAVAGTSYAYVVRGACDAAGTAESVNSNCLTATRLATPAAPTGVAATTNRCTDVQVTWNAVAGATSYNVLRGTACGTVLNTFTNVTSPYNDTSAVAGTNYQYWVVAVNACGMSANSGCAAGTRLATPAAPAVPTFTNVACATLTVNWTAVAGASTYDVYRRNNSCGNGTLVGADVVGTSFNDTGLAASSTYAYYVVAKNACGSSANGACTTVSTTGTPAAPAAPTLTPACTSVGLSWTAVAGATDYEVWRNAGGNCTGAVQVAATTAGATTYNDTGRTAGTQYSYTIRAKNSCGTSANGTCATTTTLATPAAPTGVSATGDCNGVSVSWNAVAGATGYDVIRGTSCGTAVTTFANATSPYADTTGTPGTTYQYWVVAKNACGNSPNSGCAAGTRLACPNLVYKTGSFAFAQQQGDADTASMSPGEKWRLSFVLTNTGTGAATTAVVTVTANNGVASGNFCVNPVAVGNVGVGADSATLTADFIVPAGWAGSCPSDVSFGFVSKTHAGGAAGPNETPGTGNVAEVKKAMGVVGGTTPGSASLTSVADAYGARANQNTNYGTATFVRVGGKETTGNSQVRGLVQFDLSSIPAGATITSATLELTAVGTASTNRTINVLGVTSSWAEGTVTWATLPTNDGTTQGSFATGTTLGLKTAAISAAFVQGWVDTPATNLGFWLQDAADANNTYWDFGSRENATSGNRPRLVVNYTTTSGADCSAWGGTASCSAAPRPVPDGQFVVGTAMTGAKASGTNVTVDWDVSACAATNYNVYVGTIGNFGAFGASGVASCSVGVSGTTTVSVANDSWWIVAGSDGATKVSSFGRDSAGAQSAFTGWGAGGQCATFTTKDTTGTCP